jgi:uncharacterized repeat protein (TIGR01451 family)
MKHFAVISAIVVATWAFIFFALASTVQADGPWYVSPAGSDSNDCLTLNTACRTIAAAIGKAVSGDTILVASGTYTENITISKNVTLVGADRSTTILDGGAAGSVVTTMNGVALNITNLTITHGSAAYGGGIHSTGSRVTLNSSIFRGNTASSAGGAIYNGGGTFTVNDSLIDDNTSNIGGGIRNDNGGTMTLNNALMTGNHAHDSGAINNYYGTMTLNHCAVTGNDVVGQGGGIDNNSAGRMTLNDTTVSGNTGGVVGGGVLNLYILTLNNSTVSGNTSGGEGGGIDHGGSLLTLNNSTVSNNAAGGYGGGIGAGSGTVRLNNSTVVSNSSYVGGGGLNMQAGSVSFKNTIIAGNTAPTGPDCRTASSRVLTSQGYNLIQNTSGCTISGDTTGNITGQSPRLGPLQDNGGATFTHALLAGSPAIDAVGPANCTDYQGTLITADERGADRPADGNGDGTARCDIGAYEVTSILIDKAASLDYAEVGQTITYTYRIQNISQNVLGGVQANDSHLGALSLISTTLAPGEFTTGVLTYVVAQADLPGPLANKVWVSATVQPTGTLVQDTDAVSVALNYSPFVADLEIRKTITPAGLMLRAQPFTYTIAFVNKGPYTATYVLITDVIPSSPFVNLGLSHAGAALTQTGAVAYAWQVADLAPGQGGVITISGMIDPGLTASTSFDNVALITGTAIDTDTVNNNSRVPVTAVALNAPPTLTANAGLHLERGRTATIGASLLHAADSDNSPAQLTFTLITTPTNGHLVLSGLPLGLGNTFTQADIDAGRLAYIHDGSPTITDSFTFQVADGPGSRMSRLSVSSAGVQGDGDSYSSDLSISADGRYVVFYSTASNLVSGDTNGTTDVFVRDRLTGQTERVSVASDGTQANGMSVNPTFSADGRYIAFASRASNLVAGDTNGHSDIFVRDRLIGQTTRVSVTSGGGQASGDSSFPSISADGRYVAFNSQAADLVGGDTNNYDDVFVYDRLTGQTTRVSVSSTGAQGSSWSENPSISADGRYVAFESYAKNLVNDDTNNITNVFVHDCQTGQTTRLSSAPDGTQANGSSGSPSISADGRYVAFESGASNLVSGDTNGKQDAFIFDRQTGQASRVSVSSGGQEANDNSFTTLQSISSEGRYVTFSSWAGNLDRDDTNSERDVFVHDRQTGETRRVSVTAAGAQANSGSYDPSISMQGRITAFCSIATNLVGGDTNGKSDTFAYDAGVTVAPFTITVVSFADLNVSKTVAPALAAPGNSITYTIVFTNGGPHASQAVVHDAIPVSVTNTSVTSSGVAISQLSPDYTWSIASLEPGARGIITITGVLSQPLAAGTFTNTTTIAGSAVDSDTLDNASVAAVTVLNAVPVAGDDSYTVDEDYSLAVAIPGLLDNDSDANGDLMAAELGGNVATGTLALEADGSFVYTPTLDFNGPVTFTYRAGDGAALSGLATVTITVNPVNDPPSNTVPMTQATNKDTALVFSTATSKSVAIGDVDAAGNPLRITLTAISGTLTLSGTNGLVFGVGDGVADAAMTFTGTLTDANAALDGLAFDPIPGYVGPAGIIIAVDDQGYTGSGGPLSDSDSVDIAVIDSNGYLYLPIIVRGGNAR